MLKINVLEAVEKLNQKEEEISALRRVIGKINTDKDFYNEVTILENIIATIVGDRDRLKDVLSKTQIHTMSSPSKELMR